MSIRRPLLLPLSPLYGAVLAVKWQMLRFGWLKQRRLASVVISVGSVSAGGAGKTPVVMALAGMLRRRGYAITILTRGFGRAPKTVERVEPYGDAAWFGDEPVLLAQRTGVPVFVGADRYSAGLLAEQAEAPGKIAVHLLDDGFQHRKLARDIDVVLLTQEDVEDTLLPAGNLREPLSMLREADVIVVREEEAERLQHFITDLPQKKKPIAVWVIRRRLSLDGDAEKPLSARPLAFCGIARPKGFTDMLLAEGCLPVETTIYPDHHAYTDYDIKHLLEAARQHGADGFVTTEKDAVKLTPVMREHLEAAGPLVVARLSAELVDEQAALLQLLAMEKRLDRRSQNR
ncbi:tetraacyldisaccharide 4'-kinase [Edaphobacter dinghuensis]|uniref:Tetraacyldisaccharide 4'-kinase n=1 Tax=Edaphobacter dinghuensis TaxID=1560005 RepID=A0A917MCK4_9BACT|nr:tetraacyldisaccharide 4'-kinase [Edaphobacter dinghuensis]GGG88679.1 tetraacyldisaccharide 4'-kinase [Edaphobacter dinghuensis]